MTFAGLLLIMTVLSHSAHADCISKRFEGVPGHTACIKPNTNNIIEKGVSGSDKELILRLHNEYRAKQPAADMLKMVWDDEIAAVAEKWADNCQFNHDKKSLRTIPGRFSVGQNLALGTNDWEGAFLGWYNEIKDFTYNSATNNLRKVGHFTQVVWAKTNRIGCAYAKCSNLAFSNGKFYVCNYGPTGNGGDFSQPYKAMTSRKCEDCPGSCNSEGLCDCGGKTCENGGTLDLKTCTCECKQPFHSPGNCQLDCSKAIDKSWCATRWSKSHCSRFSNVPDDCPNMCNLCPYGDADFASPASKSTTAKTPAVRKGVSKKEKSPSTKVTKKETPSRRRVTKKETPSRRRVTKKETPSRTRVTKKETPSRRRVTKKETPSRRRVTKKETPSRRRVTKKETPSRRRVTKKETPSRTRVTKKETPSRRRVTKKETPSRRRVTKKETPSRRRVTKKETPSRRRVTKKETLSRRRVTKKATPSRRRVTKKETPSRRRVTKKETPSRRRVTKKETPSRRRVSKQPSRGRVTKKETPSRRRVSKQPSRGRVTKKETPSRRRVSKQPSRGRVTTKENLPRTRATTTSKRSRTSGQARRSRSRPSSTKRLRDTKVARSNRAFRQTICRLLRRIMSHRSGQILSRFVAFYCS